MFGSGKERFDGCVFGSCKERFDGCACLAVARGDTRRVGDVCLAGQGEIFGDVCLAVPGRSEHSIQRRWDGIM